MKKYTESHEWIFIKEGIGTVGISEYAQRELGEIVYVELPEPGKGVKINQELIILESTKAAADIYSPVSGTIVEINEKVKADPSLINSSAEDAGWLYKIVLSNESELDTLLDHPHYINLIS